MFFRYSGAMMEKKAAPLFLILSLVLFVSCSKKDTQSKEGVVEEPVLTEQMAQEQEALKRQQEESLAIQSYIQGLDPVHRYSQLFLVNLEGSHEFYPVESLQWGEQEEKPLVPGGYVFFSYNVAKSPREVAAFTASIQGFCQEQGFVPPLLTVDQEGGMVNRLRGITSSLPSPKRVAQTMSVAEAQRLYSLQAVQMRLLGFHLNLAPVAEATSIYNQEFLDTRSYGDPGVMEDYVAATISGFQQAGLGAVAKHFPGNTNDDPHTGLPEIPLSQEELQELYLEPFRCILKESEPWGLLMSHVRTSAHDPENPACLSRFWVTKTVREDFGYQGLIFSDDIFMAALEKNGFPPERAVVMAIEAGVDVIMLSEKRFGSVLEILLDKSREDPDFKSLLDSSVERILLAKVKSGLMGFREGEDGLTLVSDCNESDFTFWNEEAFQTSYTQGQELYEAAFGGGL